MNKYKIYIDKASANKPIHDATHFLLRADIVFYDTFTNEEMCEIMHSLHGGNCYLVVNDEVDECLKK